MTTELDHLAERGRAEIASEQIKTVPAPSSADHPQADLLRLNGFQARFADELPETSSTPHFASWPADRVEELLPVVRGLFAHATTMQPKG